MGRMFFYWVPCLVVLLSDMVRAANSIDTPPKNVTTSIGNDVTFECGATLDYPTTDMLRWMKATTEADMSGGKMVWCSLPNKLQCPDITDTDKYEIVDTYNLVIKNVQTTDAGIYWCDLVIGQTKGTGVLIVVEEPSALPAPDMEENKETKLSCEVLFGAPPRVGWMFESNTPRFSAFIGSTDITGNILPTEHEGELGLTPWKVKWDYVHNATAEHDNKQFICEVHTTNPYFEASASALIRVKHSVRDLRIVNRDSVYTVGDVINCTASGYPYPGYRWNPLEGGGTIPQSGASLLVQRYMLQEEQHWECIAMNVVGDIHQVKTDIVFQVEDIASTTRSTKVTPTITTPTKDIPTMTSPVKTTHIPPTIIPPTNTSRKCAAGRCFTYLGRSNRFISWHEAAKQCTNNEMILPVVGAEDHQHAVEQLISENDLRGLPFWLGASIIVNIGDWYWVNQTVYKGPASLPELPQLRCAMAKHFRTYGRWDNGGRVVIKDVPCYDPLNPRSAICSKDTPNGTIYQISKQKVKFWHRARHLCFGKGWDIAKDLPNPELLSTNAEYWIGLRSTEIVWLNGDHVTYGRWPEGLLYDSNYCLFSNAAGLWSSQNCDTESGITHLICSDTQI